MLIGKYQRRFPGFDEKIIAMYARGLSTRDIQAHIEELYGIEVSPATGVSSDRCGVGGGDGLAEPASGAGLRGGVLRCAAGQDPRRGPGTEPGGVPGHGDHLRRRQGRAGAMDRAERGGQVLASDHERAQGPGRPGRADRGGGRVEGLSRRDHQRVSRLRGANLRGSPDPSTRFSLPRGGTESRWRRPSRPSTGRPRPRLPQRSWTVSKPVPGVNSTPPWCTVGAHAGRK